MRAAFSTQDGVRISGVYCAGWIKRGPSGVIGTNKKDAAETVEAMLADARNGTLRCAVEPSVDAVDILLSARGVEVVEYDGWSAIDSHEFRRGEPQGRPRVKLVRWDELLAVARGENPT